MLKNFVLPAVAAALLLAAAGPANAAVKVFACEPEWAALAREIGGDRVTAYSATHARQDPHHIRARPSLVAKIRRAGLVVCSGAGLEVGWLPLLLQRGGGGIQAGKPGHLMTSGHVEVIEKPVSIDRSLGDLHPEGNPHVHLDPRNILSLAETLSKRLSAIDPSGASHYADRLNGFTASWKAAMARWAPRAAALRDVPVVVHHKFWSYFIRWTGMRQTGTLEAKPGIPPSVSHLEALLASTRESNVRAILRTPYDDTDPAEWLSSRAGVPVVELPATVDREAPPGALAAYFDDVLSRLEKAIGQR
ncbi:MAG: zinc ABC transporter substrate-binding protein [Rhodospirillaceae bacterium]|nr:zinc ABC transporter substrate-binding protein [Rhodospirillaceae bacterium]